MKATPGRSSDAFIPFSPQILNIQLPAGAIEQPGHACGLGIGTPMYPGFFILTWTEKIGGNHGVSGTGTATVNIHLVLPTAYVPLGVPAIHRGLLRFQLCSPWARLIFLLSLLSIFIIMENVT